MNLLEETLDIMALNNLSAEDVIFIGSLKSGHSCTWEEFQELADQEYDRGYGAQWVASDLTVLFYNGSRLIRNEHDGYEWWDYISPPVAPRSTRRLKHLFSVNGWETLGSIN